MIARDLLAFALATDHARDRGIMLSGGLDSAVMLALACDLGFRDWDVAVIPKRDGAWHHADRVLCWINHRWGLALSARAVGDPDLPHDRQLASGLDRVLGPGDDRTWYSAENRVPDDLPGGPLRRLAGSPRVRQPWWGITKEGIVAAAMAADLGGLVRITHSCTERDRGRCGLCWQCGERAWAFGRLGLDDPGTG